MHRELNNMLKPVIESKNLDLATIFIENKILNLDLLTMFTIYGNHNDVHYILYTINHLEYEEPELFSNFIDNYINSVNELLKTLNKNDKEILLKKTKLNLQYMSAYRKDSNILTLKNKLIND